MVGAEFYFYMVDLDYIKNLYSDLLEKNLEVYKYPKGKGYDCHILKIEN